MVRRPLLLAAGSVLDAGAEEVVEAASAAGFDGVGLRLSGAHAGANPDRLLDRVRRAGVGVHDVEVHRIGDPDADLARLLQAARAVDARYALVVSDVPDAIETRRELCAVSAACRAAGLTAALEYMAWTTPSRPAAALEMAREAGCVVVVDVLHHCRVGAGATELRALVDAGLLGWVQLCDAPADPPDDLVHEARHGRLPPGDGALPLATLLAELPSDVAISVEVQSDALTAALPPHQRARRLFDRAHAVLERPNITG